MPRCVGGSEGISLSAVPMRRQFLNICDSSRVKSARFDHFSRLDPRFGTQRQMRVTVRLGKYSRDGHRGFRER